MEELIRLAKEDKEFAAPLVFVDQQRSLEDLITDTTDYK